MLCVCAVSACFSSSLHPHPHTHPVTGGSLDSVAGEYCHRHLKWECLHRCPFRGRSACCRDCTHQAPSHLDWADTQALWAGGSFSLGDCYWHHCLLSLMRRTVLVLPQSVLRLVREQRSWHGFCVDNNQTR